MHHRSKTAFLLLTLWSAACAAQTQPEPSPRAGEACEEAVRGSIERTRGRGVQQVQFVGAKRALSPISDTETGVRGEGRYRTATGGTMAFTYSCVFNPGSGETSGVVFRDGAAATAAAPRRAATGADPSPPIITTEACETAVAKSLKDKYPRADRIVFGSDTRRISPAPNSRTGVQGEGALVRAPGMSSAPFSYRCVFNVSTRQVDSVETVE